MRNRKIYSTGSRQFFLALIAVLAVGWSSSNAAAQEGDQQSVYLVAMGFSKTMPGGGDIPMWGFAQAEGIDFVNVGAPSVPGPMITIPAATTGLRIYLRNNLPVPVSIMIPGQNQIQGQGPEVFTDAEGRTRARSFVKETPPGSTMMYEWNQLKPGTYLYHSGTHPQVQVQMGLYGAAKKDAGAGFAYPGNPYDKEVILVYSEIDPVLHNAVATGNYGPGKTITSTVNYRPKYFLINGEPFDPSASKPLGTVNVGDNVLLRFLNAGLKSHVPTLLGLYVNLIAEDGNPYPFSKEQYSLHLAAGKTIDAILTPTNAGIYPIYDRALDLTNGPADTGGMFANLKVD